jgi:hypothetical protein
MAFNRVMQTRHAGDIMVNTMTFSGRCIDEYIITSDGSTISFRDAVPFRFPIDTTQNCAAIVVDNISGDSAYVDLNKLGDTRLDFQPVGVTKDPATDMVGATTIMLVGSDHVDETRELRMAKDINVSAIMGIRVAGSSSDYTITIRRYMAMEGSAYTPLDLVTSPVIATKTLSGNTTGDEVLPISFTGVMMLPMLQGHVVYSLCVDWLANPTSAGSFEFADTPRVALSCH